MACRYFIDSRKRLVISRAWDRVTFADAREHQERLAKDPEFDPTFDQIIDTTGITALALTNDEAISIARRVIFSPQSRRVFVASNPTIYGVARLMGTHDEIVRANDKTQVVPTVEAALKWLGRYDGNAELEFRRSTRVSMAVAIEAYGVDELLHSRGETIVVNSHGALISSDVPLRTAMRLFVHVFLSRKHGFAEVVHVEHKAPQQYGIELDRPQNIWGLARPPEDWSETSTNTKR